MEENDRVFIGGEWLEIDDKLESEFPFTGETWATFPRGTASTVDKAVAAARDALDGEWGRLSSEERGELLSRLAERLEDHAERIATVETYDNGKPISETRGMANSIPGWYEFFGSVARTLHNRSIELRERGALIYTRRDPIGVVGAIAPYNSPIMLATWKIAPALAAGAPVVLKPSKRTPGSALEFAKQVDEAGFPPGAVNVVTGTGSEVGNALVGHPDVDKISFTGGTSAGKAIASRAGENVTPLTLELGGKSANIIFEDADVQNAIHGGASGMFKSAGQSCTAGSRLFVHESIHDEVVEEIVNIASDIRLGDPREVETEMGPITHEGQMEKIQSLLETGVEEGAKIECGGARKTVAGCDLFFEPTVLSGVTNDMTIAQEEVFGPVLSVIRFNDEEEVIEQANGTGYGLAAGVWTEDYRRAHRVATRLNVGRVWVNMYKASSFAAPQGGRKKSGYGVENGIETIESFTAPKSIWMNLDETVPNPYE